MVTGQFSFLIGERSQTPNSSVNFKMKKTFEERPKKKLQASQIYRDVIELVWPRRKLFLIARLKIAITYRVGALA